MAAATEMTTERDPGAATPRLICVGAIVGAHGVRGAVKIKSFTAAPADIAAYGPLSDESGRRQFALKQIGEARGLVLATIDGVRDRDQAEALRGTQLFVDRARLPRPAEEEYYHADLIGLDAEDATGKPIGVVRAVLNHGAGDVLEISLADGGTMLLPFTRATVPVVDLAGGRVVVDPPADVEDGEAQQ